jgi:GNAT superfamily N-acetyltransferase
MGARDSTLIVRPAESAELEEVRNLFREYQTELDVDLCFQSFEEELATLPGKYAPPKGELLLGLVNDHIQGCVAFRFLEPGVCEMKRLFVRPDARSSGLGGLLVEEILKAAIAAGYEKMVLDTLDRLQNARKLYERNGFITVPAYYENPLEGVIFMERKL